MPEKEQNIDYKAAIEKGAEDVRAWIKCCRENERKAVKVHNYYLALINATYVEVLIMTLHIFQQATGLDLKIDRL